MKHLHTSGSTPHLLIVDDDERIRLLLKKFLVRSGFLVSGARDAAQARRLLAGLEFDMLIVDVMMPGEDGFTLTRDLRRSLATPILLLTARGDTDDRIKGLEMGADDYLPKPFEPQELLARINAILRRVPRSKVTTEPPQTLHMAGLRYDVRKNELWCGDKSVRLTVTEAALMRLFATRPHETLKRSDLVEQLGRNHGQTQERAIDVQITRLRRKLEPDPKQPRYLQTVRGAGYMLAPD